MKTLRLELPDDRDDASGDDEDGGDGDVEENLDLGTRCRLDQPDNLFIK